MSCMSLPPALAAKAGAQGGPFTTEQAEMAGFDDREIYRRIKSGAWTRLRRGVYVETDLVPDDDEGRHLLQLRAVVLTLPNPAVASHITAAALFGVALLEPDLSLVHITREHSSSSRTESGICHHVATLPPSQLTKVDGLLTTSVARAVIDFAREAPFDAALVVAESALNKKLTTLTELREVLAYCADWPGARNAARVVSFASPYSETAGETLGRIAFDVLGIPQPSQQTYIYDEAGFVARVDYYWEEQRTIGEFDGRVKYVGEKVDDDALIKEKRREDRLRDAGAEVFRFDYAESRAKSPSIRRKAFAAFKRAAKHADTPPRFRYKLQPPPE